MITDKRNIKVLQQIATEINLNLTDEDIYSIVDFQYETIKNAMEQKRFVELPYFGRFHVKGGRDKYIEPEKRFYEPHMNSSKSSTSE
tara:strand:- start:4913 stop:5173 length:261 start_codon:yes stop_codon:yes gene_type:complete